MAGPSGLKKLKVELSTGATSSKSKCTPISNCLEVQQSNFR